jgi:hypothetical protein
MIQNRREGLKKGFNERKLKRKKEEIHDPKKRES